MIFVPTLKSSCIKKRQAFGGLSLLLWGLFSAFLCTRFEIALGVTADGANGGGGFAVVGVAAFHAFPSFFGIVGKNSAVFHVGAKAQKAFFVLFFNGGNGREFCR